MFFKFFLVFQIFFILSEASSELDLKGFTPFFLQDPKDSLCLGSSGFTICDEHSLWILSLTKSSGKFSLINLFSNNFKNSCLGYSKKLFNFGKSRSILASTFKCSKKEAKSWDWSFVSDNSVKLSIDDLCLSRGSVDDNKNSISLEPCDTTNSLVFNYHPTYLHDQGFMLKSIDGNCFNGNKFTSCVNNKGLDRSLLWGVGLKIIKDEVYRYFFKFIPELRNQCLAINSSGHLNLTTCDKSLPFIHSFPECDIQGTCNANSLEVENQLNSFNNNALLSPAYGWTLLNGKFEIYGKCLVRYNNNSAGLDFCHKGASEYLQIDLAPR